MPSMGPPSAAVTSEDRCHPRGHRLPRRRVGIAVFLSVNEEVAPQALSQAGDMPALWCPLSTEPGAGVSSRVLHMQFEPLAIGPSHSCLFTSTLSSLLPVPCTSSRDMRENRFSFLNFIVSAAVAPACADASVWTLTPCPLLVGTVLACLLLHLVFILYLSKIFFSPVFLIYLFFSFSFSFFLVILQSPTNRSI